MNTKIIVAIGLVLICISQLLMSFGYSFLMAQKPIDFAHWSLFTGSICLFALWSQLPKSFSKTLGLTLMTLGIGGVVGMCVIDFILWASNENQELKDALFTLITQTPSLNLPFLIGGPTLFYAGICIASYGLFTRYMWQVVSLNAGALMIGLGHMIFHNRIIPVIGSVLLLVGLLSIIWHNNAKKV